jgi:hypothetical protein
MCEINARIHIELKQILIGGFVWPKAVSGAFRILCSIISLSLLGFPVSGYIVA